MSAGITTPRRRPALAWLRNFGSAIGTIMVKELRSRMRGRRAFIVLTVYLTVLAAITYAVYQATYQTVTVIAEFGGTGVNASASIGQAIFATLSLLQMLLIAFIAPAFTAGAISLEREKQTLDLLVTTPLRPGAIVVGKLLAALAFVFLLILASVPLSAIVLMYGGVGVDDMVRQFLVLVVAAIGFGAIGLFFSALVKRTQAATVLTYSTMLLLTLGTTFVYLIWGVMGVTAAPVQFGGAQRVSSPPEAILYLNPFVGMADVIASTEDPETGAFTGMLAGIRGIDRFGGSSGEVICQGDVCVEPPMVPLPDCAPGDVGCISDNAIGGGGFDDDPGIAGHFWPRFVVAIGWLAIVLTVGSVPLVAPVGGRPRRRRRTRQTPEAAT